MLSRSGRVQGPEGCLVFGPCTVAILERQLNSYRQYGSPHPRPERLFKCRSSRSRASPRHRRPATAFPTPRQRPKGIGNMTMFMTTCARSPSHSYPGIDLPPDFQPTFINPPRLMYRYRAPGCLSA